MVTAGDFRNGVTFEMDGGVYSIIEFQHVKPAEEQEALKRNHQQSMKRYSETAVIAKELDYQYCCFCDRWNGSLKDIKKDYIAKCVFHKSPKKPMEVACEYFEPDYGRMTLASIGVIDV